MDVTSLRGLFTSADNTMLKRGQLTIEATMMNEEEAKILQIQLPAAAFYLEHLFYDFGNRPISWGWFIFHSGHLRFLHTSGYHRIKTRNDSMNDFNEMIHDKRALLVLHVANLDEDEACLWLELDPNR